MVRERQHGCLCSLCERIMSFDMFHKGMEYKKRGPRFVSYCKVCQQLYLKYVHYPENKEKYKIAAWKHTLKKKFNMTIHDYELLLLQQGGGCAICGTISNNSTSAHTSMPRKLCVDHDHITGTVRGILCNNCNTLLGNSKDSISILKNAIKYLGGNINE